jgi:DNA-binding LytR/AlgR family response regulator
MLLFDYSKPVACITGTGNYTRLHHTDGSYGMIARTLKNVLPHYPYLIRVHKHAAVNPAYTTHWDFTNRYEAKVRVTIGGQSDLFAISRRRIKAVKARLSELQQKPI